MPSEVRVPETTREAVRSEMKTALRGNAQRCTSCGLLFTSPSAGDAHRVTVGTYDIVRLDGRLIHIQPERDEKGRPVLPEGARLVSTGNAERRCLTADELAAKGLVTDAEGRWRFPPSEREWWGERQCTSDVTLRDEEHRLVRCRLTAGHDGDHEDGHGVTWTGGE